VGKSKRGGLPLAALTFESDRSLLRTKAQDSEFDESTATPRAPPPILISVHSSNLQADLVNPESTYSENWLK
jgi:hypothetical protein